MIYQNNKMLATSFTSAGTSIDIEEYDTDDGWHVRKWSDGYIEMIGSFEYTAPSSAWVGYGTVYNLPSSVIPLYSFPFSLTSIYSETLSVDNASVVVWVGQFSRPFSDKTRRYGLYRINPTESNPTIAFTLTYFVTGRWKQSENTDRIVLPAMVEAAGSSVKKNYIIEK